jgi:DNA-binding PadR family transcriptional regulator
MYRKERSLISKALIAASARPLILGILFEGENYGYQIIRRVKLLSEGRMQWSDGTLYPVLHRLEKEKLISSEWRLSENGRMRKYYTITEKGLLVLEEEKKQWFAVHHVLKAIWG